MGDRTQHEGKTERAKESHDRCSQPPGMRMPKTADLGTQALLVVNSFKLQGWRSGESARFPPMWPGFKSRRRRHMWVEFVVG